MTTKTYKYRVAVYKEVVKTPLKDYKEANNEYIRIKKSYPFYNVIRERVEQ